MALLTVSYLDIDLVLHSHPQAALVMLDRSILEYTDYCKVASLGIHTSKGRQSHSQDTVYHCYNDL